MGQRRVLHHVDRNFMGDSFFNRNGSSENNPEGG